MTKRGRPAPALLAALRRARDVADREFAQPFARDHMAKAAHLSKFHFARAFAAAYSETPMAYLLARPAPPMFSEPDAEALRGLIAKGSMAGGVIETDD